MNRQITFELPEELVERAQAAGLLTSEQVSRWLENELQRETLRENYRDTLQQLRAVQPPLSANEIEDELEAYRGEKKRKAAGNR